MVYCGRAALDWIYNQKTHFNIYTIQLISLLVLSQKLPRNIKGIFCKINTGEGKSTIRGPSFVFMQQCPLTKKQDGVKCYHSVFCF